MKKKFSMRALAIGQGKLLRTLAARGMGRQMWVTKGNALGSRATINGKKMGYTGSLNILDVGSHSEVIDEACRNLRKYGYGCPATNSLTESEAHRALAAGLSRFQGVESVLLLNTGYQTSAQTINILASNAVALEIPIAKGFRHETMIFYDELAHASLQSEIRRYDISLKARGKNDQRVFHYPHLNYSRLQELLWKHAKDFRGLILIVGDALHSMSGAFDDFHQLIPIAKEYGAVLVTDEAHSVFVYGFQGRGALDMQGIAPEDIRQVVRIGTLSKAGSSTGGWVNLPKSVVELQKRALHAHMFTVGRPPYEEATDLFILRLLMGEWGDRQRSKVHALSVLMRGELARRGFNTWRTQSHIIPVITNNRETCYEVMRHLEKFGVASDPIPPGVVPRNGTLIRFSVSASYTEELVGQIIEGLEDARNNGLRFREVEA